MSRVRCYGIAFSLMCLSLAVNLSLTQSCGKRKLVNQLIVNGTESQDGHWPWYAALFHNKGLTIAYACGGTILNENTVLTAAHCVMTARGLIARRRLTVQVGRHQIRVGSNRVQELEAFELIVHPEYSVNGIKHDIALVVLATDITYTDFIQPVCLWNRGDDINAIVGSKGTVIGFGIDETDDVADSLREASIPVVSHITCIESNRNAFAYQLTSNMFCAGNRDGISACNGDSGGGLFFNYSDTWFIRGVVSFTTPRQHGNNCDTKEYTVFTDVAKYLQWIDEHVHGIVTESNPTIRLLPMSTCGPNPYADREELSKPLLAGYPWMGYVECTYNNSDDVFNICHAILISDLYVIVTVRCGNKTKRCSETSVLLGDYNMDTTTDCAQVDGKMVCSPPVQTLRIESVIIHPEYNDDDRANDIALIRLRDRADTSKSNVKPICLPVTNELRSQKSTHYTSTVWNYDYTTKHQDPVLRRSLREILPWTECREQYKQVLNITTRQMCTKVTLEALEVCQEALPAAPLQLVQQVQGESRYVLYGTLSLQVSCVGIPLSNIYSNVAGYVDWILETIQE